MSKKSEKKEEKEEFEPEDPEIRKQKIEMVKSDALQKKAKCDEIKKFIKRLHNERQEAELDSIILKAQEVADLQNAALYQEEKLAAELDRLRREEVRDLKMRQYLRENSHELKELERQLKLGYNNRMLQAQMKEHEAARIDEMLRDMKAEAVMVVALGDQEEKIRRAEAVERKKKEELRVMLQDQIIDNERRKQEKFTEKLKEREVFAQIAQKIQEEDQKDYELKVLQTKKIKEEMEETFRAKELWKTKERMVIEEERRKLAEYERKKEERELQGKESSDAKREARERLIAKIGDEMMEKKRKEEELNDLVRRLIYAEKEDKERTKEKYARQHEYEMKLKMRESFKGMWDEKIRRQQEEEAMDKIFADKLREKLEEDNRLEQLSNERKRLKRIEIRKEVEEAIKQRRQKRAEELQMMQLTNKMQENIDQRRQDTIEAERMTLLKEHAPQLMGYFPKGVLRKEDLAVLGVSPTGSKPKCDHVPCTCETKDQT